MSDIHQIREQLVGFWQRHGGSAERLLAAVVVAAIGFGVVIRSWRLAYPAEIVFDETFFAKMAAGFFKHDLIFDAHPALGKYIIAIGIRLFGDTPFGWRIMPLLAGLALIPLLGLLTKAVVEQVDAKQSKVPWWIPAAIVSLLVAIDGMFVVYSRFSLMEGILLLVLGLTMYAAYRLPGKFIWVLGLLIGLCVGMKWLAIAIVVPVGIIAWQRKLLGWYLLSLPLAVPVYLTIIFTAGSIGGWSDPVAYTYWWHDNVWQFEINLKATHPWGSEWWSWPLLQKPLLFYRNYLLPTADSKVITIVALPNPLIWWASAVFVLMSMVEVIRTWISKGLLMALRHPLIPLLAGWGAFFLPWMLVHRVLFIYHYFPSYMFALLMMGYWVRVFWPRYAYFIIALLVLAIGLSIYFLPVWVGLPLASSAVRAREWLPTWVF